MGKMDWRLRGIGLAALALMGAACSEDADDPAAKGTALLPSPTIYVAATIITMDPARPRAQAVAVAQGRVLDVGSLNEVSARHPGVSVDETFAGKVMVAGLIDQHLHPFLSAVTLTSEIVSIEDWVLPGRIFPAARGRSDYLAKLGAAEAAMADPEAPLISWGFHHYFHGKLTRGDLDAISGSRPIIVWHRSAHEFILNSPAIDSNGVTEALVAAEPAAIGAQIDLAAGHFWERGAFEFLLPRIRGVLASPKRFRAGLELTEAYLHASGVTLAAEPGGSSDLYDMYNSVLGDAATPFRFYFMPGVQSGGDAESDGDMVAATENNLAPVTSNTAPLLNHVKLFSDGAMFSQLMQMQDGYDDGHHGEWLMEPETFARTFRAFWDAGYQIHVHQNGDAGLQLVLDTL